MSIAFIFEKTLSKIDFDNVFSKLKVFFWGGMFFLCAFLFDVYKITLNTSKEIEHAFELKRITKVFIDYKINSVGGGRHFDEFFSYFLNSGYYSKLFFVYDSDGRALYANSNWNPSSIDLDMRDRPWYKEAKTRKNYGITKIHKNAFNPYEEVLFFYYPIYREKKLIGVGDYDIRVEDLMRGVLGFISVRAITLDLQNDVVFDFYLSGRNWVKIIFSLFFSCFLAYCFIVSIEKLRYVINNRSLCSLSGLKRRDSFKASKLDQRVKALCFLDIDHFKSINDTYGHDIGDEAIKAFANCLKENIRDKDVAFRWGGEEFLVIIRGKVDENIDVYNILDRLRASVEVMDIDGVPQFTVSIGYCHYDSNVDAKELIKQADLALYESKRTGRNKVSEYKNSMSGEPITA